MVKIKYLKGIFLLLFCSQGIAQITPQDLSRIINETNDNSTGVYIIKEWILYENKKISEVYPIEEKIYIDTKSSPNAYSLKDNKIYFYIKRSGNNLTITNGGSSGSFSNVLNESIFNSKEFVLKLYDKNKEYSVVYSIVKIKDIDDAFKSVSQGSGIVISKDGHIITNSHVVNNSNLIKVEIGKNVFEASILYDDPENDIALLALKKTTNPDSAFKPLYLSSNPPSVGDDILALGFPLLSSMGYELKLATGIISSLKGIKDDNKFLQFSAPVDPGNSGGPLLNSNGDVIGIISSKLSIGTNVGYALKIEEIPDAIKKIWTKRSDKSQIISKNIIYSNSKKSIVIIKSYYL